MSLNFVGFNEFGTQSLITQSKRWGREGDGGGSATPGK